MSKADFVSQSPLIGAFVPGLSGTYPLLRKRPVSIPSDRGIRSGSMGLRKAGYQARVSIPSDRGNRSGLFDVLGDGGSG